MNDRQHELEKNLLAEKLAHMNTAIEPYSKVIAVVVGLVIVGGIVLGLRNMSASENRSDSTFQLLMNQPDVAEKFPDTTAAAWAKLNQGNEYLAQGLQAMYSDRDEAVALLDQAKTAFKGAMTSKPDQTLLVSRSHLGLAMVAESLGEFDEAIAQYKEVIATKESKVMVANAEKRIAALENPSTKEFLAWFSEQDFSPADPDLPPSLPDASGLPPMPDMGFPPLSLSSGSDTDAEPAKIEGGLELPADMPDSTKTETETPEADSAKTEKTEPPAKEAVETEAAEEEPVGAEAATETDSTETDSTENADDASSADSAK
ncbi:tetratricopeptide repeat protein [Stieleria varia]|uniref:Uncharacterized protein n=1 Tax=Stieleria varia TaxID=2528005 RepID=A0A5C6AX32_9BACT|nr:tetratricopeptide repeat protein [Stieleria varia]TWU02674.1 hypothetical protein Pla52n_37320 [Stieleria varia]